MGLACSSTRSHSAWHFVRVGQTCQGTNMISMKADIASVPPKITKDKIESSGLSVILVVWLDAAMR